MGCIRAWWRWKACLARFCRAERDAFTRACTRGSSLPESFARPLEHVLRERVGTDAPGHAAEPKRPRKGTWSGGRKGAA
eukprot:515428-Pyramimonas_sp.AAC.1